MTGASLSASDRVVHVLGIYTTKQIPCVWRLLLLLRSAPEGLMLGFLAGLGVLAFVLASTIEDPERALLHLFTAFLGFRP